MNPYLNDPIAYRKKKTRLFKWKVVEAYRAERVQAFELEDKLGLSETAQFRLREAFYILAQISVRTKPYQLC